ncbi:MAG: nitrite/sulfite reductase [Gammaproteobacteria bacterium]
MYRYDEFDRNFVEERVSQFREQVARRLNGALTEDEFAPLRLQNGLYSQRHAYMLRVAIPYGTLSSSQLFKLADVADKYDRGYGHLTTRQNIQFNWLSLDRVPDLLAELAQVEMHAIQTSGNCIRNITSDPFAGAAGDELVDPRPVAELLRQWSTLHPEFAHLPRKFKIAITGARADRAAIFFHDIGLRAQKAGNGNLGFEIIVGGGQGRTPIIGQVLNPFVPFDSLLPYLESVMRVYNLHGRRDNKYKARIKILVQSLGVDEFRRQVEADFNHTDHTQFKLATSELRRIEAYFAPPKYAETRESELSSKDEAFLRWVKRNVVAHRQPGYRAVTITVKSPGRPPGDITSREMRTIATLADRYSCGELRVSHEQNLVFAHVRHSDLHDLWQALSAINLGESNSGLISDIIACPGLDYCNLANARSIPLATRLGERFGDPELAEDIGPLSIKISGCVNACGHHHVGHIGILGVSKGDKEFYQLTLGGEAGNAPALGERLGRAITEDQVLDTIDNLIAHYRKIRQPQETFVACVARVGVAEFKESLNAIDH